MPCDRGPNCPKCAEDRELDRPDVDTYVQRVPPEESAWPALCPTCLADPCECSLIDAVQDEARANWYAAQDALTYGREP